jgi:hypothetical protein
MRRLFYSISISILGCNSDDGLKTFNDNPEATITSHDDGDEVLEGYAVLMRAQVSDSNNSNSELEVSWYYGEDVVCDWTPPDTSGLSECSLIMELA